MKDVEIELLERLTLLDATEGPKDVAPIEEISYKRQEGGNEDGGNR